MRVNVVGEENVRLFSQQFRKHHHHDIGHSGTFFPHEIPAETTTEAPVVFPLI